jgi:cation transport ATPase
LVHNPNVDLNGIKQDQKAKDLLIQIASSAEQYSEHPLAKAVVEQAKLRNIVIPPINETGSIQAFIGRGVQCKG